MTSPDIIKERNKPSLIEKALIRIGYAGGAFYPRDEAFLSDKNYADGCLETNVTLRLSFKDRILLLISGVLAVKVCVRTDILVSKCDTRATAAVLFPFAGYGVPQPTTITKNT